MARGWANGQRGLSDFYAELLSAVFRVQFQTGKSSGNELPHDAPTGAATCNEIRDRLTEAQAVDDQLIELFESHTQSLRLLDRQLGAAQVISQTETHLANMVERLHFSLPGGKRSTLAETVAETAALAGWQALDLGEPSKAWRHHETAKAAARESGNIVILTHVTAQQAYALLDTGKHKDALSLILHATDTAIGRIPSLLTSWLLAAQAEAAAASGEEQQTRRALDAAYENLLSSTVDSDLPFIVLDETHLNRWRGHCLARLGSNEAIDDLTTALSVLDSTFTRATAGLHCDLAMAYQARGDHSLAIVEAERASMLATRTASVRQRRRIDGLLIQAGAELR